MNVYDMINSDPHWGPMYRCLQKGTVTHKQIEDEVKILHIDEYTQMLTRWMEGNLFFFQKASFDAWLDCDKDMLESENSAAQKYMAFELGCSEPRNEDIHEFIIRRILKFSIERRKSISENNGKREVCRDFWRKENIKFKWDWRND